MLGSPRPHQAQKTLIWWLWIVFGIVLLVAESATPGTLFFLFFGVSATIVGGLAGLGLVSAPWLQWLLFSVIAVGAFAVLRGPLRAKLHLKNANRPVDSLVGEAAVVLSEVPAGGVGKVELRGTGWSARSTGGVLSPGQRVVVEKVEGLTLWVRSE
jgi:membrane protein implicated in regulation of membrane protease activity